MTWKAVYKEEKLADVMRHFTDGFLPPEGERFPEYAAREWFIDHNKGVVIFKLYTEPDK